MEAVLEAQEKGTTQVNTEYELMFDQEEGAYRVLG
jgi:predicted secreted protein